MYKSRPSSQVVLVQWRLAIWSIGMVKSQCSFPSCYCHLTFEISSWILEEKFHIPHEAMFYSPFHGYTVWMFNFSSGRVNLCSFHSIYLNRCLNALWQLCDLHCHSDLKPCKWWAQNYEQGDMQKKLWYFKDGLVERWMEMWYGFIQKWLSPKMCD